MAWNHKTRVVALAAVIQPVSGTFVAPTASDIIPVSIPTNGEDLISTEDPTATGSAWTAPRVYLGKTGNVGATAPLRGPGGAAPFAAGAWPLGRILMAGGFAEVRVPAAITGTVQSGSTTTAINLASSAGATDDLYIGMPILHPSIGSGAIKGASLITDYTGTSRTAALAETLSAAPSGGTYTIPPNVTYQLGTMASSPPLLSVTIWRDRKRYDYRDVRVETLTFDMPVANEQNQAFPSVEFALKGLPHRVIDEASPPLTAAQLTAIAPFRNGKFMLDRVALGHQSTRFQIGAEVAGASNAWAEFGQDAYDIMSASRTFDLDLNQMAKADFDIDTRVDSQKVMSCMSMWGMGPGNRFGFCVPEVVLDPLNNPGDRNGFVNLTGNAVFAGVDKSATLTVWWADDAVAPTPSLGTLTISQRSANQGYAQDIDILGATPGSTITGTVPAGMTINSAARKITGTPTGTSTADIQLTETLAGSPNSPRANTRPFKVMGPLLALPRIGIIGPSTSAQNNYGATGTPYRAGNLSSGPLIWALAKEHVAEFWTEAKSTAPYYTGDNQAVYGATQDLYDGQITALIARMSGVTDWGSIYEVGRNDIQNNAATVTELSAWTQRDVGKLRAGGAKFILVVQLWKKMAAWGGVWAAGGPARQAVDDYNAWLETYAAANADISIIRFNDIFMDPNSPIGDPYSWVTRNNVAGGMTHYSALGAKRGGEGALLPALRERALARPYPARPAGSLLSALSGTGGTKTNATGTVVDDWALAQTANTATVVGSTETINGEVYQVATVSATNNVGANGGQLTFSKVANIPVAAGKKVGIRGKVIVPATAVPYGLVLGMGSATGQGAAAQSRTFAMIPQTNDDPTTVIAAPGATWAATPKFDGSTDLEMWFESSSYVLGDTGGSTVAVSLGLLFGPGAAGDAIVMKMGQLQTFELP